MFHKTAQKLHPYLPGNTSEKWDNKSKIDRWWVSWCFEPSQPQTIILGLETNVNLSLTYSAQKLWNRNIVQNPQNKSRHKHKAKHTNIKHKFPKEKLVRYHPCHEMLVSWLVSWCSEPSQPPVTVDWYRGLLSYLSISDFVYKGKYRCCMASCCTCHRPTIIS